MDIKRGTTPHLSVRFNGLDDDAAVESIEFLFKQHPSESAPPLLKKRYPDNVRREEGGIYRIFLTAEETRRFTPGKYMHMDTRITLIGGDIPPTSIVTVMVTPTLFSGEVQP